MYWTGSLLALPMHLHSSGDQNLFMKAACRLRTIVASAAIAIAATGLGMGDADAGWVQLTDPNSGDAQTNPGYPGNQNSDTIGDYLKDLLDLSGAPSFVSQDDNYGGGALSGLGNPDPGNVLLLAFHFGNGNDYWQHTDQFDVFFGCATNCDTFTLPSTKGVSNYRLYGAAGNDVPQLRLLTTLAVPEPATLALLGAGIFGIAVSRRRRQR